MSPKFRIRPFEPSDEEAVVALWKGCGLVAPQNDPYKDIHRKLAVSPEAFLLGVLDQEIIGSCMLGYEGHRGWINYLSVHPNHQRKGYARLLMDEAEDQLRALGCLKINLQVRESNAAVIRFYESLGFTKDPVVSLGKRLETDL